MSYEVNRICIVCGRDFSNRNSLHLHVLRHLSYRRYSCSTCNNCFYTEEEREEHCKNTLHINMFEMKVNQYNEMLVKQLMRDIEVSANYDMELVIRERARAGLAFEKTVEDLPPSAKKRSKSLQSSPNSANRPHTRCSPAPADPTSDGNETPQKKRKLTSHKSRKPSSTSESNTTADDFDKIPVNENENLLEISRTSLATVIERVRCKLCKTKISAAYEIRKDHVSLYHMPNDHNESDYVDILEHKMQEAFPGVTFSDYQCQFPNCSKVYKSQSSRRSHVMSCHFSSQIKCPMEDCTAIFSDAFKVHTHLKTDHKLPEGAKSMKNTVLKYKFEYEKRAHNSKIEQMVRQAFPCPIPTVSKGSADRETGKDSIIRDGPGRFFQVKLPPLPRRARSSSSSGSEASPNKLPLEASTPKRASTSENIEDLSEENMTTEKCSQRKERERSVNESKQVEEDECKEECSTPVSSKSEHSSKKSKKKRSHKDDTSNIEDAENQKRVKVETSEAEDSSQVGSLHSDFKEEVDDPCQEDVKDPTINEDSANTEKNNVEFRYECNKRKALLATPPCSAKIYRPIVNFRASPTYTRLCRSIVAHVAEDKD